MSSGDAPSLLRLSDPLTPAFRVGPRARASHLPVRVTPVRVGADGGGYLTERSIREMTNYHAASVAKAVGDHYGLPADRRPASSEHVAPFFAIIVSALGLAEAGEFVEATRRAHRREKEHADKGGHKFAFAVHMSNERGNSKGNFFRTSGREAMKGIQAIVSQDSTADLDDLLICAIAALRGARQGGRPAGVANTADRHNWSALQSRVGGRTVLGVRSCRADGPWHAWRVVVKSPTFRPGSVLGRRAHAPDAFPYEAHEAGGAPAEVPRPG